MVAWWPLAACASMMQPMGPVTRTPALEDNRFIAADGAVLPMRSWLPTPPQTMRAMVLGVHGFNDYSNSFALPGPALAAHGIAVYAYDQRGFGRGPRPGIWAGVPTMVADFDAVAGLLQQQHPDVPLYVLGESMGGALAIAALTDPPPEGTQRPKIAGTILAAPAVWGSTEMPVYQRTALWLSLHLVPWLRLTGSGFGVLPSDNFEMLRGLGHDPLVIKATRVDTIAGLVELMGIALDQAKDMPTPLLVMYGAHEQVLPQQPILDMLKTLPKSGVTVAIYPDGYHMLMRDLKAETVLTDIVAWISNPKAPLPSEADTKPADMAASLRGEAAY